MAKFAKTPRRALKRATSAGRSALRDWSPDWLRRRLGPTATYLDMLFIDHGIFRIFYLNLHRVGQRAWRAAQPAPHQISRLKRLGIKTIVNLRGDRICGSYWLEKDACEHHGIRLTTYRVRSRDAPTVAEVLGARDLFATLEYPILIHCKSGADRAGLMTALYLHFQEGVPVEEARHALALKYGHFRQADTGILDYFFERYLADTRANGKPLTEWVVEDYDPAELRATFRAQGWANRIVNTILRRE